MLSRRAEFVSGMQAELPILVGVAPFGMIYGALAMQAGIPKVAAQAMSAVVFAGSSQFVATQLVGVGAPGLVLVLTIAVINLRHALYSASLAPFLKRLRPAWKWLLAYLLTDEAYAVTIASFSRRSIEVADHDLRHWYFLGAGLALWSTWQISTAVGIMLGAVVPASWSLDFTLALTFIALVAPLLQDRASWAAALAAGITAVLAYGLPYKLGLMAAALVGILAGMLVEGRK
ncbi:MAG: AzlC family ABC transporter permease [Chloroflexota bacterium]